MAELSRETLNADYTPEEQTGIDSNSETSMFTEYGNDQESCDSDDTNITQNLPSRRPKYFGAYKPMVCSICNKRFADETALEDHFHSHPGNEDYVCDVCDARFPVKSKYYRHMATHQQPHCGICQKFFSDREEQENHMKMHVGKKLYSCNECGKVFTKQSSLKQHLLIKKATIQSVEKPPSCSICHEIFAQKSQLEDHMGMHAKKKIYSCPICGDNFTKLNSWNRHKTLHTETVTNETELQKLQILLKETETIESEEKLWVCNFCHKKFEQISELETHMGIHAKRTIYSCDICGASFTKRKSLDRHKTSHKDLDAAKNIQKDPMPGSEVETSSVQFQSETNAIPGKPALLKREKNGSLQREENSVSSPDKSLKVCSSAQAKQYSNNNWQEHLASKEIEHIDYRSFIPNSFNRRFSQPSSDRCNPKEKSYYCDVCRLPFVHKEHRSRHMLIHIRKKLYCDKCGEQFTLRSQLNSHILTHTHSYR